MSRPTLARRIASVTTGVVLIAAVVTALISVGLIRGTAQREARQALGRQADVVVSLLDAGRPANIDQALRVMRQQATPVARVLPDGRVRGDALARKAIQSRLGALSGGARQSFQTEVDGRTVMVEARPLQAGGGIVLARTSSAALGPTLALLQRGLLALAVGLVVAVVAAVVLARWLAAPLHRTAEAAGRLAAGEREVRLDPGGPREVAQVAESVNTLATALQASESRQREFLLSVSHELRTPLTGIRGFAESLADEVVTEPEAVRGAGQTILAESQRLERLVGDLLDLARLGADDFRLDVSELDLREVVSAAGQVWRARCDAVGVAFGAELPSAPVLVRSDAARLRQVIDGLAENALRVTPAGRPLVLALSVRDGRVVIQVRDGGPGLTPSDREVAFERSALYERYRGVRRVGTGLGLALVKALATRLGGSVEVGTAPEGGACFGVLLPLRGDGPVVRT